MAHFRNHKGEVRLEPMRGSTYDVPGRVAAYAYDVYPPSSVLAGEERRSFLESFNNLADAVAQYPTAYVDPLLRERLSCPMWPNNG